MPKDQAKTALPANQIGHDARPRKATTAEHKARIEYVMVMLCQGYRKGEVKRFFRHEYGVSARTVERYIRLARDRLVQEVQIPKDQLVAESFGFYRSVLNDRAAKMADKIKARERADKLMGLDAPVKVAPNTPDGTKPYPMALEKLTDEELAEVERAAELVGRVATDGGRGGGDEAAV